MNAYSTAAFFALIFNTAVGLLVWRKSAQENTRNIFGLLSLCISFWVLGCFGQSTFSDEFGIIFDVILYTGACLAPVLYLHFLFEYTRTAKENFVTIITAYVIAGFFLLLNWIPAIRPLFIASVSRQFDYRTIAIPGPLWYVFLTLYTACATYCFWILKRQMNSSSSFIRNQAKYFLIAYSTLAVAGTLYFALVFNINAPPIDNYFTVTYGLIMAYAILRYRLMDFNLVLRLLIAYSVLLLGIGLVFAIIIWAAEFVGRIVGLDRGVPTLIIVCLAVIIIEPVRSRIISVVIKFIFKSPDFQSQLAGISSLLAEKHLRNEFAEKIAGKIKAMYLVDHAGLAIWDFESSCYRLLPESEFNVAELERIGARILSTDFLVRTLQSERRLFWEGVVVEDELDALMLRASQGEKITFSKIKRTMRWLEAKICVPLTINGTLAAFLILGSKPKGPYNAEDKKFLFHVAEMIRPTIKAYLGGTEAA